MREPSRKLKESLDQVRAPWDEARTERTLRMLPRRRRQKRMRTVLGAGTSALLLLGCVWWLERAPNLRSMPTLAPTVQLATRAEPPRAVAPAQQLRLPDGSTVALLDADTDVAVKESSDRRITLQIAAGRARFDVPVRGERVFELRDGREPGVVELAETLEHAPGAGIFGILTVGRAAGVSGFFVDVGRERGDRLAERLEQVVSGMVRERDDRLDPVERKTLGGEGTDETEPPDVPVVVLRLRRAGYPAGHEQPFAQVVLHRG
jgi:hypothetical protein